MLRFVVAIAAIIISALAVMAALVNADLSFGIDVSQAYSESDYRCLKNQFVDFVIARAYRSTCAADPTAPGNLRNAKAAGMLADIYMTPCGSESPSRMIQSVLTNTPKGTFGKLWINVESGGGAWSQTDKRANCDTIGWIIDAAQSAGLTVGIYSSAGEWGKVTDIYCTIGVDKGIPIWYSRFDGVQNYSDYEPFGGWTPNEIAIHQYADNIGGLCGVSANADAIQSVAPPPPPPTTTTNGCMTFFRGLCIGNSACLCTVGDACMTEEAAKKFNASNSVGGCVGKCRYTTKGHCEGNSHCLFAYGLCD